jgi:hypothetical protein
VPLADWPDVHVNLDGRRHEMQMFVLQLKNWVEKVNPLVHEVTRPLRKPHETEVPDYGESPESILPPQIRARYLLAEELLNECINDMPVSGSVSLEQRETVQQVLMQDTYDIVDVLPPPLTETKSTVESLSAKFLPVIEQTSELETLAKQNSETLKQLVEEQAAIVEKQNAVRAFIYLFLQFLTKYFIESSENRAAAS